MSAQLDRPRPAPAASSRAALFLSPCGLVRAALLVTLPFLSALVSAQVIRPPIVNPPIVIGPPGGGGGGITPPIVIPPGGGGGGGGGNVTQPTILVPAGALVGETVTATVALGAAATGATGATYQWSLTGGRLLGDARAAAIQFVADATGTVNLAVNVSVGGTGYAPTAQVTVLSAASAGAMTIPATAAANAASVAASVPAAQSGDRTFRWAVSGDAAILSGQGTPSVTIRPGTAGLKEVTCNINLQNIVTVPVRSYLVVTGSGAPVSVTVNRGTGGGTYPAGSRIDLFAHAPGAGEVFDRWTGDTALLGAGALAPFLPRAQITVPAAPVTLTATYKPAAAWTTVSVPNFNPQAQTGAGNVTATVATTLAYHVPADAAGLVFFLHDSPGSLADWFERPEPLLLARELVAAGYGVAALNSLNRTAGTWSAAATLATNLDARNHAAAYDRLVADGTLPAGRPVFFLGTGAGATAAARIADLLAASTTPARPVRGAVLYLSAGIDTLSVTSRVPHFFALAANDDTLGAAGAAEAREASQRLLGRGIASNVATAAVSPLAAGRLLTLGLTAAGFTEDDAAAIWSALKAAGLLDANNYVKTPPAVAAVAAALPAAYRARAADVAAQLTVAAAGREFFGEANARVLNFLNARAAGNTAPAPGRLVNLSTRSRIVHLTDTLNLGFTLSGTARTQLLLRGIGPALARFGVPGALSALRLDVRRGNTFVASNDTWDAPGAATPPAQLAAAAATVGAFPLRPGDMDTALLLTLDPGSYTVTLSARGGAVGDVLAEIYDVGRNATRLTNLSTLARINNAGEVLIPGIVVAGNNPRTLVLRAVSQTLANLGQDPENLLGDARLVLFNGNQTVANNNNWAQAGAATLAAAFPAVGAFPLTAASDAALLDALAPGSYTIQAGAAPGLLAAGNPTGSVLVEVYEVP